MFLYFFPVKNGKDAIDYIVPSPQVSGAPWHFTKGKHLGVVNGTGGGY